MRTHLLSRVVVSVVLVLAGLMAPPALASGEPAAVEQSLADTASVERAARPLPSAHHAELWCPSGTMRREVGRERCCVDETGRRHGPWFRLHPTGTVAMQGSFVRDARAGAFLTYFPSGALAARVGYRQGREEGMAEQWYEDGSLRARRAMRAGRLHGHQTLWHPNGQKRAEGAYRHGERHGTWTWYADDGRVLRRETFDAAHPGAHGDPSRRPGVDPGMVSLAGGAGAAGGMLAGGAIAFAILQLGVERTFGPASVLVVVAVPAVSSAIGGVLALSFSLPFPHAVLSGITSGLALPAGAMLGALFGLVVGGSIAAVTDATKSGSGMSPLILDSAAFGALVGGVSGPILTSASFGWALAATDDVE